MFFLTLSLYLTFLIISVSLSSSFYFWWALLFVSILSFGIVKIIGKNKALVILPILLAAASFALTPLFSYDLGFFFFLFFSVAAFLLILYFRQEIKNKENLEDRRSHPRLRENFAFNKALAMVVMAVCFLGVFAIQENADLSFWLALLIFFAVSAFVSWDILRFDFRGAKEIKFVALISGFISMELAWALSFWPLGYFADAMILLAINYAFLGIIGASLLGKVSSKKIAISAGIALAAILIIAGTSRWIPL